MNERKIIDKLIARNVPFAIIPGVKLDELKGGLIIDYKGKKELILENGTLDTHGTKTIKTLTRVDENEIWIFERWHCHYNEERGSFRYYPETHRITKNGREFESYDKKLKSVKL